ncbi:MAG: hypothetical protein LBK69_01440 [Syntrophomonadaceae bacterium]|jgi:hypothetical protein|nr:hypothetical protein [Syntrophomonadaceae bacterium]
MSNKERCITLIDRFSESQLTAVISILENIAKLSEEAEDEAFCLRLAEQAKLEDDGSETSAESLRRKYEI